ncbi:peptidoglycan DD-metalloendopeptidase family protein [Actinocorallia sp. API 0066]|uniref:peptidoglycan DD-metalloendopeptidase family protein n=1 Tax=Actinocorallia sp. API 0066 TaxID=2896846 RepID=UPI001E5014CC|nr:peptidoglycan DD-metalloendopeptidase family protein [Actinocorallia sp. API 0066]MCD0453309.1 peptidoglycan DD-metalloendopeptidase family protein [Actinocorallia sp. API 0066]
MKILRRIGLVAAATLFLAPVAALPAAAPAGAAEKPAFQLPVPCGQRWTTSTHGGHANQYMIDMIPTSGPTLGQPTLASASGRVVISEFSSSAGNYVVIDHGGGWQTRYLHLDRRDVAVGANVERGRQLGTVGNTGASQGAHLHYEQKLNGTVVQATIDGRLLPVNWSYNQHFEVSRNCGNPVPSGSGLFALSPDRSGVFQYSGQGTAWTKVGGAAGALYSGGAGLFATNPSTGDLYRYNGTPENWSKVGGPGRQFAVAGDRLYGLSPDGTAVFQWTGSGTTWTKVGGAAGTLYAGGAGLFATNPSTGDLYRYNGTPENWSKVGGPGAQFAVTGNHVYGLSPDRTAVFQWTGSGTTWTKVGGAAATLYAGGAGLFATNPSTGDLYRYNGTPENWSKIGGPGAQFAVTGNHVYGLSPDRTAVFQWTGSGTTWTKVGGPAHSLTGR